MKLIFVFSDPIRSDPMDGPMGFGVHWMEPINEICSARVKNKLSKINLTGQRLLESLFFFKESDPSNWRESSLFLKPTPSCTASLILNQSRFREIHIVGASGRLPELYSPTFILLCVRAPSFSLDSAVSRSKCTVERFKKNKDICACLTRKIRKH